MNEDPIVALFKLGQKAHMAELLHQGHVYMNTVSYFASREDGSPRFDPDEGTSLCQNAEGGTLQREENSEWHTVGTLTGAIRFRDDALAAANLYCLHAKTRRDCGTRSEERRVGKEGRTGRAQEP